MEENQIKYWIWLARLQEIGSKRTQALLKHFQTPQEIWKADKESLLKVEGMGEKLVEEIQNKQYREGLERYQAYMKENQIQILTMKDKEYPDSLKQIYDPPAFLFAKGNIQVLKQTGIAMIGCRKCSEYGKKVAIRLAEELTKKKINIISGLAEGIDTYSHIGCLKQEGKTIAVVGTGLDRVYPKKNQAVVQKILENRGCIISEYIIGTKPMRMNFPARNRIISGLSQGVVVIEAKRKSGTLITVDFALEQGKEIYVVPGNITSHYSEGTNELIKQGAKLITNVKDIIN